MKHKLTFTTRRVKNNISGARGFKSGALKYEIPTKRFPVTKISLKEALNLCQKLDPVVNKDVSLESYFLNNKISIGSKEEIVNEVGRIKRLSGNYAGAQIITFPFKCPVPIKTNYHKLPDFGEMMFLHRLGKISREVSYIIGAKFEIHIFEETNALSPVFGVSNKECRDFRYRLNDFIEALHLNNFIKIKSLQKAVTIPLEAYRKKLFAESKVVEQNLKDYSRDIDRMLPTLALSLNTNNMTLNESRKFVSDLFLSNKFGKSKLTKLAIRYLAFLNLHRGAKVRANRFMQLTVTPNRKRIGVRPTLKHVYLLPHHGVPIVYKSGNNARFEIQYYLDFLFENKNTPVTEVRDEEDNFLFYEID